MSQGEGVLDFNEAHNSRRSKQDMRFSMSRIQRIFEMENLDQWISQVDYPISKTYSYPSQLSAAQIHEQSCYIQPDAAFLRSNQAQQCPCCDRFIRRKRYSPLSVDLYPLIVKEFGISHALYFSIIKLHIYILCVLGIYGAYFSYLSYQTCLERQQHNIENSEFKITCTFINNETYISPQAWIMRYTSTHEQEFTYAMVSYIAYLIMMMTPFMHEILIKSRQVRYWDNELLNHVKYDKLTMYIKHLPKKFSEEEIKLYIHNALQNDKQAIGIKEIVYIYDTHPIGQLNAQRSQAYLQLLQLTAVINQCNDDAKKTIYKQEFIDLMLELMRQTKEINRYLKMGLPFTNKVIIRFEKQDQFKAVFNHYDRSLWNRIITSTKLYLGMRDEYNRQSNEIQQSMLSESPSHYDSHAKFDTSDVINFRDSSQLDLQDIVRANSGGSVQEVLANGKEIYNSGNGRSKSLAELMDFDEKLEMELPHNQDEKHKDLHIQTGFREDDIFWENIGMHTLKRFYLRLITTLTTIVAGLLAMGLFEGLFIYQQGIKQDNSISHKIIASSATLVIIFLAVFASMLVVIMTTRSKRSTYSLQEKNIITFMSPIQQFCIISFPYLLALSIYDGFYQIRPLYTLYALARIRIIFKAILHVFHTRVVSYYFRRRKIINNFNGKAWFQKTLNAALTPPLFPIRSRILYSFFVYSCGLMMLFVGPIILAWCIPILIFIYFYDKYAVLRSYRIDKQFTFELLKYLVTVYQIIMIPLYAYVYIAQFGKKSEEFGLESAFDYYGHKCEIAGYVTAVIAFLSYIQFRSQIADFFVFKIFRQRRQMKNMDYIEKSYFQSYSEYFDGNYLKYLGLGIEELNQILTSTFKRMQMKK